MAPVQHEAALCADFAVQHQALHLGHGRCAVAQQGVVQLGADDADAFGVDINPGQGADEAHHIALAGAGGAVSHVDVGRSDRYALVAVEQLGISRLEVGDVGARIAHHKRLGDAGAARACAVGLQGDQIEVLAGQRTAHTEQKRVLGIGARLTQSDRDGCARNLTESRIHCGLDLRLAGIARNQRCAIALAGVGETEAIAIVQGLRSEHDPLLLQLTAYCSLHAAHRGTGVGKAAVDREFVDALTGQAADKLDVQAQATGIGLCWIETDLDVARTHIGEARQFGLYSRSQGRAIADISNVAGRLSV